MNELPNPIAYHLVPAVVWEAAAPDEPFRAASLEDEGFIHLTHGMADLVGVANAFYRDDPRSFVVLTIALRWLTSPWRYDGDERYPHAFGPLDRAAITEVRPIERDPTGTFQPIERPDRRVPPDMPALLGRLAEADIQFVVVGSSGAALLGAAIDPGDLDICPALDEANLRRLCGVLVALGARPRVAVPGWVTAEEAANYVPEPTVASLDLLFETPLGDFDVCARPQSPGLTYADLVETAVPVDVAGRTVLVGAPERIASSKLQARRPKDLRVRGELERIGGNDG
ncbi:MAG TPA: DUF952 domain-containing protein [Candidatus Limnocylindrales bacterium]|nr:DUF952 domain-containing protein [Candidatus Limnocylindrales bacterium]